MNLSRRQFLASMVFSGAGFVSTDSLFFERYFVETSEFDIGSPSSGGTPVRILQISDLHLKKLADHHKQLAGQVNRLSPDLLLFTGDIIESERGLRHLDAFLQLLEPDVQKAAVMGNWERHHTVHPDRLNEVYKRHRGELLINRSQAFTLHGSRFMVTGIDDMLDGSPDFSLAVRDVGPEEHHIVLLHCPEYRDRVEAEISRINVARPADRRLTIEYIFAGHSHGGQVNIMGFAPLLPPGVGRYVKGWFRDGNTKLYVSKGIGTSVLPVRFGARAEIAVFNYHRA